MGAVCDQAVNLPRFQCLVAKGFAADGLANVNTQADNVRDSGIGVVRLREEEEDGFIECNA